MHGVIETHTFPKDAADGGLREEEERLAIVIYRKPSETR
jgi:hypothetical protein